MIWEFAKQEPIVFMILAIVVALVVGSVLRSFAERNKPKCMCDKRNDCDEE